MKHKIQCKCGALRGHINGNGTSNRIICYCSDCRAFTKFLGCSSDVLDPNGGTEILQIAQPRVFFTQGKEFLSAVRFGEQGLVRWYAKCCNTPFGNTLANHKISFIGLIHSVLDPSMIERDFGRSVAMVNSDSALCEPRPKNKGLLTSTIRFFIIVISMRLGAKYQKSEFFNAAGELTVHPKVLTFNDVNKLKN